MEQYEHGGDIYGNLGVTYDFSINTNPLGMPEEVQQALVSSVSKYSLYPDPLCRELRQAIACFEAVSEDCILCGNGAADLIYRLCYAIKPARALICDPTFSEYERALEQAGCQVSHYTLKAENGFMFTADILEKLTPGIDILFLCHPNNPTGRLIPQGLIEQILDQAQRIQAAVVVDECFLSFTDGMSVIELPKPGLFVLKAFTKIYAMAGLRLGYLLTSDKTLLSKVSAAGQCWSVSIPAQIAGIAALAAVDWLDKTRRVVAEERCFLSEGIGKLGITVFPIDANFILLRTEKPLYEPLLVKGILIRPCGNFRGLDDSYYRVCVKTRSENTRLLQAMREVLSG
jgi:threonine-phosphate decarboxylase